MTWVPLASGNSGVTHEPEHAGNVAYLAEDATQAECNNSAYRMRFVLPSRGAKCVHCTRMTMKMISCPMMFRNNDQKDTLGELILIGLINEVRISGTREAKVIDWNDCGKTKAPAQKPGPVRQCGHTGGGQTRWSYPQSQPNRERLGNVSMVQHQKAGLRTADIRIDLYRAHRRRLIAEWIEQDYQRWHAIAETGRRRGILRPLPRRLSW
jgi:hypothetical protein